MTDAAAQALGTNWGYE